VIDGLDVVTVGIEAVHRTLILERLKEVSVTPLSTGESDWYESMDAAQSFLPA
jgi:hypothetical protein